MPGYGTLAPPQDEEFQWEKSASPMKLLTSVGISVGKNLVALLLLFWQLFKQRTFLMNCDRRVIGNWTYPCEYTKAYIRCFPLLASIVVLVIAGRQLLQRRLYYGLLKRGALLDFHNTKAWHDPLFFILTLSFLHGIAHFVLDLFVQEGTSMSDLIPGAPAQSESQVELQNMVKHFVLPSVVFFAFLVSSYDLESQLLPISKYFEENPSHARQTAARMPFLDELEVQQVIPKLSLKTSDEKTTLDAVYREIIERTPELAFDSIAKSSGMHWHLVNTLWPSKILLDPRLTCAESREFWWVLLCTSVISSVTFVLVFAYFCYQVWKDTVDVWEGQYEDALSLFVLALHAAVAAWIALAKFRVMKVMFSG